MTKIWLKSYQEGVPAEIDPDAYTSLVDIFDQSCKKFNNNIAYSNIGSNLSFQQLYDYCRSFSAYCQKKLKLEKGERLAIMLPNLLQYPVAMFGGLQAGLIIVNVNPLYTARELTHQLKDSGATTIVVLANFAHVLQEALPQTDIKNVIVTELGDLFKFPKSVFANFIVKHVKRMVKPWSIPNAIKFNTLLKEGKHETFEPVPIDGKDLAYLQYTGGTTGISKGAELTHRNIVANLEQASAWLKPCIDDGKEIIITALPLYHIFSLTANCLVFMKHGGQNVLITNPRDIPRFVAELTKIPFTAITGVNTLFNALLNYPKFKYVSFNQVKFTLGGGMAVQQTVALRWKAVTGKALLEAYGLTETSPGVTINPLNLKDYNGSIGLPLPSTDVTIRDDDGNDVPIGEAGELLVKGPQVMRAYWKNSDETKKVFTQDGWLKTGDIAIMDDKGFLKLVDRKKDMILVSGFNVYPNEVEDVIAGIPGVLEVAVVAVPDEHSTEAVKAFIVKKNPNLTADDVLVYCHKLLTGYKIPKYIEFRQELPKTNVGKILRRALRDEDLKGK